MLRPLGLHVLEAADSIAVRYAGRLLADLGATVHIPSTRRDTPPDEPYEFWLDAGKSAAPHAAPDIVLTDRPGARTGEALHVAVEPFGDGPYADYAYADIVATALSGWLSVGGFADRPPLESSLPRASFAAGANAAAAAVVMLVGRARGAAVRAARVSALDVMHHMHGPWSMSYPFYGTVPAQPVSNLSPRPWLVAARDGYVATPMARSQWDLVGIMLQDERLQGPEWNDPGYVMDHRDQLQAVLVEGIARRTTADLVESAADLALPWGAVQQAREIFACPHLAHRSFFRTTLSLPGGRAVQAPALPFGVRERIATTVPLPDRGRDGASVEWRDGAVRGETALRGVRVVEITVAWAGPFIGRMLADAGATVIKVESGRRPDTARGINGIDLELGDRWWDRSVAYSLSNSGKYHVGLELDTPEGLRLFLDLVRNADVLINNHSPRVMKNIGLDFPTLAKTNPHLIYFTPSGFGEDGPYRDRTALGWSIEAMAGITANFGYPDHTPVYSRMPFPDVFSALHGLLAVAAALAARDHQPGAQWLDLSQYESGIHAAYPALLESLLTGTDRPLLGSRNPHHAPQGVYACDGADSWLALAVTNDNQWRALCRVLEQPALAERWPTPAGRQVAHDQIDVVIAAWCRSRTKEDAAARLQAVHVPAAPVLDAREVFFDPHHRARNYVCAQNDEVGMRPWPSRWQTYDDGVTSIGWAAARFGEHNDRIFGDWMGISAEERDRLRAEGVIVDRPSYAFTPVSAGPPPAEQLAMGEIVGFDTDYRLRVAEFCALQNP